MAASIEFDIANNVSLYAGVWASNINFGGFCLASKSTWRQKGKLSTKTTWNVQLINYLYPGSTRSQSLHYFEVMPSLSYDFGLFEIGGGVACRRNARPEAASPLSVGDVTVPIRLHPRALQSRLQPTSVTSRSRRTPSSA